MRCLWVTLFAALLASACSGESNVAEPTAALEELVTDAAESTVSSTVSDVETTTSSSTTTSATTESSPSSDSLPPATPFDSAVEPTVADDDTVAWISRRYMSAEEIGIVWSVPPGAVRYEIHRIIGSDVRPEIAAMTDDNRIHDAGPDAESVFADTTVTEGSKYWYGIRGMDSAGVVVSSGWHQAHAITDEEPPSPVEPFADVENGEVLLSWSKPDENYQLHAYEVRRAIDGGEPDTVSTTWNLDQTSFLDPEPPAGVLVYSVVAIDFHWNKSEETPITVDLATSNS